jgi:hypothetical protein
VKTYSPEEFPVRTEVFSRVVGYIRPVSQWNDGKQEEFRQRKTFEKTLKAVLEKPKEAKGDEC